MTTYEQLHAGDIVRGEDGASWGVDAIEHTPRLAVTLIRVSALTCVTGYPPPGMPVEVLKPSDVSAEFAAAEAMINAGLGAELTGERWKA